MNLTPNPIFDICSEEQFDKMALQVFHYQYSNNSIYRLWVDGLNIKPESILDFKQIPFLPIQFFKSHEIFCGHPVPQVKFISSGTTETGNSAHFIKDISLYEQSFNKGFSLSFGNPENFHILALLPSYLERTGSSLVYMMEHLIKASKDEHSGFYLHDFQALHEKLKILKASDKKTMLWGVSYALLDFCEEFPMDFPDLLIIETGGMKGKREEMIRQQLHSSLCKGFGVNSIASEYGMTELLSQAYSLGNGIFKCPPWMKIRIRDVYDPLSHINSHRNGAINIIDLANLHSCSFIATDDIGVLHEDQSFEVLGRTDNSDIRGCNLLYS